MFPITVGLPALGSLALIVLSACGGSTKTRETPSAATSHLAADSADFPLADQAGAGVDSEELQQLLVRHWDLKMQHNPVWAGTMGDHRFDDKLSDNSEKAILAERQSNAAFLAEALALGELDGRDKTTLALFVEDLERRVDREKCQSYQWSISARDNPVGAANRLPQDHHIVDLASAKTLVARYRQIPQLIDNSMANLRKGLRSSMVANTESIRRTIAMIEKQIAQPRQEWALLAPASKIAELDEGSEQANSVAAELRQIVKTEIAPSFERYLAMLTSELLPAGRAGSKIGVHALPGGTQCYQASIRSHINLPVSAKEIHELGLVEIARINKEMTALGKSLFGTTTLAQTVAKLRSDKTLYFDSAKQIVDKAEASLAKAKASMATYFGVLPKADCIVVQIPEYEAPFTSIAYYRQPHADGKKPGEYFINTHKPTTRPRYEMEVLAFHESIPGHHLQIAISQERDDLPLFRRQGGSTAFVEGWALYTERLSDEMGLYSGDLDRMGMLSYDAWRASRLVVDTGIHSMAWTRAQAEKFMQVHTALTKANIGNEVDRYISWPGQAVAYKIGQLEIFRLRSHAQKQLGDTFDIRRFHDAVLKQGAVVLPVLAEQIDAWIASEKSASGNL